MSGHKRGKVRKKKFSDQLVFLPEGLGLRKQAENIFFLHIILWEMNRNKEKAGITQ